MNSEEFYLTYSKANWKDLISVCCSNKGCENEEKLEKGSAVGNIKRNGRFICRSCSFTHEGKLKISEGSSYKRSDETKKKMSEAKLRFYKTPQGEACKKRLSILTAKGHAANKYENAKRNGWHKSPKAGSVFYGSSYELRLCWLLDRDENVVTYQTQIYYTTNEHGRCLDFVITDTNGKQRAIEVKPESRLSEQRNIDQIRDSQAYAQEMGYGFEVYSENNFGMTAREIRDWSDQYLTEIGGFDWVGHRKASNLKKAKKFYEQHIATDKVEVWCEYCKETHNPLRLTYDKNIARNSGKYICEKHGGFIAGSKPKKKKENPYAVEGKKQCNRCKEVKSFNEFGVDKVKSDGYATRCKICRSQISKEKYNL